MNVHLYIYIYIYTHKALPWKVNGEFTFITVERRPLFLSDFKEIRILSTDFAARPLYHVARNFVHRDSILVNLEGRTGGHVIPRIM